MIRSSHDGVKRSDGRGWVSSKYSLGSGSGLGLGLGLGNDERDGEDGLKKCSDEVECVMRTKERWLLVT
ncbi:unnamed protein product [Dovyalis caffra]|uniref:Uncharacterized protein n=1 Tax=Dovyalis caffra TaxID=77055 RepID=A0AAV1QYN0_9ROSI|nr:unnamed protein product [Dovyalis caffra]